MARMPTLPSATPVTRPVALTVALALSLDDQAIVGAPVAPGSRVTAAVIWSVPATATFAPSGATVTDRMPAAGGSGGGVTVTSSPHAAPTSTRPDHRIRFSLLMYSPQ